MSDSRFATRLGELVAISPEEQAALARLEERERIVRRGATIQRENDAIGEMLIIRRGMMMSSRLMADGSRQIMRFLFPGDMGGMSNLIYRNAAETVTALADSVVAVFDRQMLSTLIAAHPRLSALMTVYDQIERTALTDRLAAIGRSSARARVAAVLIDMRDRLRRVDAGVSDSFLLVLTQEEIGDATGLTAVHVNRMLRQLEQDGLIAREGGRVTLRDERALRREANYVDRYQALDLGWLPPPN